MADGSGLTRISHQLPAATGNMRLTLLILAAGVGRRFGGLKQLEPVGPGGEALMDYTVFDALRAGFSRVVLVVRRETEAAMARHLEMGFGARVEVRFVHQELDALPAGFSVPGNRTKPWGTGHAVLSAVEEVAGPFAVANADDYYGAGALPELARFLEADSSEVGPPTYAMVGFQLGETLPESGTVSRGLCRQDATGWLQRLQEIPAIQRDGLRASWEDDGGVNTVGLDALVSMNLWAFGPALFADLERRFEGFLSASPGPGDEFYLPMAVNEAIAEGLARVRVLEASGQWCGMTSREDRDLVAATLRGLVEQGVYPPKLWD